jgi:hypothetical protein
MTETPLSVTMFFLLTPAVILSARLTAGKDSEHGGQEVEGDGGRYLCYIFTFS